MLPSRLRRRSFGAIALLTFLADRGAAQEASPPKGNPPEAARSQPEQGVVPAPDPKRTEENFVLLMGDGQFSRVDRLDRVAHWSRAVRDADAYLGGTRDLRIAAYRAHADRMKRLHEKVRVHSGEHLQPGAAECALSYREEAERDLRNISSQTSGIGVLGTGLGEVSNPLCGFSGLPPGVRAARAVQTGLASEPATSAPGAPGPRARREALRIEIAAETARDAAEPPSPATRKALERLEEPLLMNFANETPLGDVLHYVKYQLSKGPEESRVPLYIDPLGLVDTDLRIYSNVVIDMEGVPLKTSLRLVLKQVGLAYCVRDGVLIISSPEGVAQELREARAEKGPAENQPKSKP